MQSHQSYNPKELTAVRELRHLYHSKCGLLSTLGGWMHEGTKDDALALGEARSIKKDEVQY